MKENDNNAVDEKEETAGEASKNVQKRRFLGVLQGMEEEKKGEEGEKESRAGERERQEEGN